MFLDIDDQFVCNYVEYHLGNAEPLIRGRLKAHIKEWEKLNAPSWILSLVSDGLRVPFEKIPPPIILPNNKTAVLEENRTWVRETLLEYIRLGFVKKVDYPLRLILPLQVSQHSSRKKCLIHDETALNDFVFKS